MPEISLTIRSGTALDFPSFPSWLKPGLRPESHYSPIFIARQENLPRKREGGYCTEQLVTQEWMSPRHLDHKIAHYR